MKTRIHHQASFLWLADDLAIYSYGNEDHGNFLRVEKSSWEEMGKPEILHIQVDVP